MQAQSVLLEPYYNFTLELPEQMLGRAMADMERIEGSFLAPVIQEGIAYLIGEAPVSTMQDYQKEFLAYTKGLGRLFLSMDGYKPCHNEKEVMDHLAYDAEGDMENPADSVFCSHGAGFIVKWDKVKDYMHLESVLPKETTEIRKKPEKEENGLQEEWMGEDEVEKIFAKTFFANKVDKTISRKKFAPVKKENISGYTGIRNDKKKQDGTLEEYILIDGYNVIFTWEELRELARVNIDGARDRLLDIMCNYQGIKKCHLMVVFDAYQIQGHRTEILDYHNIHVVYTKEAETADQYIEKFAHENSKKYQVTVVTSDGLEQIIIHGQGCLLMSSREFLKEVDKVNREIQENYLGAETEIKKAMPLARLGDKMPEIDRS